MSTAPRRRLAVLVGLVVLLLTSGCVELPQPVTGAEPPRPSLTVLQAAAVFRDAQRQLRAADRTLNTSALTSAYGSHALEAARGAYDLSKLGDGEEDSELGHYTVEPQQVWSTDAGRYPQLALVEARVTDRRFPRARLLHQLVRADAGARWLVHQQLYPETDRLQAEPALEDGVATVVAGEAVVNGLRVDRLSATLADALNRPNSEAGRRFAGHPRVAEFDDLEKHQADLGEKKLRFFDRKDPFVLAAAAGGAVALVPVSFLDTLHARPDEYLTLKPPYQRTFSQEYQEVSQSGLATCLLEIPARGKVRVSACGWSRTRISTG